MPGKRGFGMPGIRKLECGMRKGEVGMRKVECNEKRTEECRMSNRRMSKGGIAALCLLKHFSKLCIYFSTAEYRRVADFHYRRVGIAHEK